MYKNIKFKRLTENFNPSRHIPSRVKVDILDILAKDLDWPTGGPPTNWDLTDINDPSFQKKLREYIRAASCLSSHIRHEMGY